jgi:SNF2 family DNA or RNA helicase
MITITLTPEKNKLLVYTPYNPQVLDRVKTIQGRVWNKRFKAWMFPFTQEMVDDLKEIFKPLDQIRVMDEVDKYLNTQYERQKQVIELKSQPAAEITLPPELTFHTEPLAHQRKALSLCLKHRSFGLFMEMGTGKTKIILDMANYYKESLEVNPCLVVCPVSVMDNWVAEIHKHQPSLKCMVLGGVREERIASLKAGMQEGFHIFVVNYESAWRLEDELLKYKWGMVVLDESTKIKHRASQQAKGIMRISKSARRRYIMSGTPMPNSPLELFNQIKFLDETIFGSNFYVFRDRYAVMGGYQGYQIIGWKNLEELATKLGGISYRVLKKECLDLPDKIYKEYRLSMSDAFRKIYEQFAEEMVAEIGGQIIMATVVLAKLTKLRQLTSGFVYDEQRDVIKLEDKQKLEQLKEILEEITPRHKVVIWTTFRHEMTMIEKLLKELNLRSVKIDGTVPQNQRQEAIRLFQEDAGTKVFVGQQHAGGLGITLTAADYCIFFSNDYSPEVRLQCEDRLHRIGQKNPVTYIDIIMKATIDVSIMHMLKKKQDLSNYISAIDIKEVMYGSDE